MTDAGEALSRTVIDEVSSADLLRRFAGLERLYGVEGAARIRGAHVAVIGIGGVGSWAAEALARSGFKFSYPVLGQALRDLEGQRKETPRRSKKSRRGKQPKV